MRRADPKSRGVLPTVMHRLCNQETSRMDRVDRVGPQRRTKKNNLFYYLLFISLTEAFYRVGYKLFSSHISLVVTLQTCYSE